MSQRYSVTPHPVETLLTWVKSGEIAIPEIQRPFVWEAAKVRNLLDLTVCRIPNRVLDRVAEPNRQAQGWDPIGRQADPESDGQQRVTALMAGLLGLQVLTKDYRTVRVKIAFHPVDEKFEVSNPAIAKDGAWISDIADLFAPDASLRGIQRR